MAQASPARVSDRLSRIPPAWATSSCLSRRLSRRWELDSSWRGCGVGGAGCGLRKKSDQDPARIAQSDDARFCGGNGRLRLATPTFGDQLRFQGFGRFSGKAEEKTLLGG